MESTQYQFRAKPEVEAQMRKVWLSNMNTTDNMVRIIRAGCSALAKGGVSSVKKS